MRAFHSPLTALIVADFTCLVQTQIDRLQDDLDERDPATVEALRKEINTLRVQHAKSITDLEEAQTELENAKVGSAAGVAGCVCVWRGVGVCYFFFPPSGISVLFFTPRHTLPPPLQPLSGDQRQAVFGSGRGTFAGQGRR